MKSFQEFTTEAVVNGVDYDVSDKTLLKIKKYYELLMKGDIEKQRTLLIKVNKLPAKNWNHEEIVAAFVQSNYSGYSIEAAAEKFKLKGFDHLKADNYISKELRKVWKK